MAGVSVVAIEKSFGATAVLKNVSIDVAEGEFLTLVGPSGCGKSTLLRIIAGLERQDAGSILIDGVAVDDVAPKRRDIAMVFQSYALYPHMTVGANIRLPLRMRRLSPWQRLPLIGRFVGQSAAINRGIDADVKRAAEALELSAYLNRKPGQLSGGQRQRVAVGRAMVREPKVFLMDEPLSNLDAKLRVQMRAEITDLHRRLGATFVYVTHDQAEAMTMSDRVAVMMQGELLQVATPKALYADPASLHVAEFIGSPKINRLAAIVRRNGVEVGEVSLPIDTRLAEGTAVILAVRPESLSLADQRDRYDLAGRVKFIEFLGADMFVHVDIPGQPQPVIVRARPDQDHLANSEQGVRIACDSSQVLVFDADGRRVRASSITSLRASA